MNQNDTLFGGRLVPVTFTDGARRDVKVRQLPLADYERAFTLRDDEIGLTAFCCLPTPADTGGTRSTASPSSPEVHGEGIPATRLWMDSVTPESYEALRAAAEEVNAKGFFAYAGRRAKREREALAAQLEMAAAMPPETLQHMIAAGMKSPLPSSSPASPRRPG